MHGTPSSGKCWSGKPAHKVVCDADLIVVGHRCIKRDDSEALRAIVEGTALDVRVWYAAGKKQSSVICMMWEYFDGPESFVPEGLTYQ